MADPTSPTQAVKCACKSCQCPVQPGQGVVRDGKLYCSNACAYDCTETTCVCVHDRCGEDDDDDDDAGDDGADNAVH